MPLSLIEALDLQLQSSQPRLTTLKSAVKQSLVRLAKRFASGEPVEDLVRARADFIDLVLSRIWHHHVPANTKAALIAVGGYGRAELHPASDVDVLILLADEPDAKLAESLSTLVTCMWDIGLEIGHSVRTLTECVSEAKADVTIATNLMESRILCGEERLFQLMQEATGPDRIWPSELFFAAKFQEQQARHARFEDTSYNLEPNIKSSPGGLRDIQMIGWVAKRHFGAKDLIELVGHGFLTEQEYQTLYQGQLFLWKIRFALHLLSGHHNDRLSFEYQRAIATSFGYVDEDANLAVEQFMQHYYQVVMSLNRLNEMLLQLFQEVILLHGQTVEAVAINRRFQVINGFLEVTNPGLFARYPLAMLELFLILQEHPEIRGVRASTIRLVHGHLHLIDDQLRGDLRARSLFMEIMRQSTGITHALRRMNRYGVLARYIPAFGKIVGRMQFDLFHVYTVDEHTLMVVRNLRRLALPRFRDEFPYFSGVFERLVKPELIYLAALFHDIAKGRGGDHAAQGALDARAFCKLHHLSGYDSDLVAWLVRHHLVMSVTAQRKDIDDPAVVHEFATLVAEQSRLDYLFLLTMADMRGTDPAKWNSWKQSLLTQLYANTTMALTRGLGEQFNPDELIQEKRKEALRLISDQGTEPARIADLWRTLGNEYFLQNTPEEMAWHGLHLLDALRLGGTQVHMRTSTRRGADEILVCTQDRDDLFAHSVALLDQLQLNVLEARIRTLAGGICANSFFVLEKDGSHAQETGRREQIAVRMSKGLDSGANIRPPGAGKLPRKLKVFGTRTRLHVVQNPDAGITELHINAADKPGLLADIGLVFSQLSLRVHNARISTLGAEAEDVFFVTDRQDRLIESAEIISELDTRLKQQLAI